MAPVFFLSFINIDLRLHFWENHTSRIHVVVCERKGKKRKQETEGLEEKRVFGRIMLYTRVSLRWEIQFGCHDHLKYTRNEINERKVKRSSTCYSVQWHIDWTTFYSPFSFLFFRFSSPYNSIDCVWYAERRRERSVHKKNDNDILRFATKKGEPRTWECVCVTASVFAYVCSCQPANPNAAIN